MARLALHPQVTGSVSVIDDYRLEELEIAEDAAGVGRMLADVRGGSMIVALRRDGQFQPQPPGDTVLRPGDVLVATGTPNTMDGLEKLFEPG